MTSREEMSIREVKREQPSRVEIQTKGQFWAGESWEARLGRVHLCHTGSERAGGSKRCERC